MSIFGDSDSNVWRCDRWLRRVPIPLLAPHLQSTSARHAHKCCTGQVLPPIHPKATWCGIVVPNRPRSPRLNSGPSRRRGRLDLLGPSLSTSAQPTLNGAKRRLRPCRPGASVLQARVASARTLHRLRSHGRAGQVGVHVAHIRNMFDSGVLNRHGSFSGLSSACRSLFLTQVDSDRRAHPAAVSQH